jgi:hypothetical protein
VERKNSRNFFMHYFFLWFPRSPVGTRFPTLRVASPV